jgi:hypothetical protein
MIYMVYMAVGTYIALTPHTMRYHTTQWGINCVSSYAQKLLRITSP